MTISHLSQSLDCKPWQIIETLMSMGKFDSITQDLTEDQVVEISRKFNVGTLKKSK